MISDVQLLQQLPWSTFTKHLKGPANIHVRHTYFFNVVGKLWGFSNVVSSTSFLKLTVNMPDELISITSIFPIQCLLQRWLTEQFPRSDGILTSPWISSFSTSTILRVAAKSGQMWTDSNEERKYITVYNYTVFIKTKVLRRPLISKEDS